MWDIFQDSSRDACVMRQRERKKMGDMMGEREEKGWIVSMAANDGSWQPWDGHRAGTAWKTRRLEVLSMLESPEGCFLHPWTHLWQRNRDRKEEKYEKRMIKKTGKKLLLTSSQGVPRRKAHSGTMEWQEEISHPSLRQENTALGRGSK